MIHAHGRGDNMDEDLSELNSSILDSVKVQLGIPANHTEFDQMLQLDINMAFSILNQLGVGPKEPFSISDNTATWDMFITQTNTEMAKQFVALKTKELFDPPSGAASDALTRNLNELTWRLNVAVNEDERAKETES